MTLVGVQTGLLFPGWYGLYAFQAFASYIMDAATEKVAHMGHVYINGRGSKTLSAAGGGSIAFRTATCTWADGGSTLDIGLQDLSTSAGPPVQPDGTFDVKVTLTGGAGLSSGAWNVVPMTGGTGTKTLNHGDLVAVVWDMTARGGSDSVAIQHPTSGFGRGHSIAFIGGSWGVGATIESGPNIVIIFDDGTLGTIDMTVPSAALGQEAWDDADDPDERGLLFQVPWDCKIDAFYFFMGTNQDPAADFTIKLYSDPTGTPALVTSVSVLSEQMSRFGSGGRFCIFTLPSEVTLTRNTNYGLSLLALGGTNDLELNLNTLGDESYRVLFSGGTTLAKITRNDSTGAFTAESPAVTLYNMGVRISQFDDGTGSGGGGGGGMPGNMTGGLQ